MIAAITAITAGHRMYEGRMDGRTLRTIPKLFGAIARQLNLWLHLLIEPIPGCGKTGASQCTNTPRTFPFNEESSATSSGLDSTYASYFSKQFPSVQFLPILNGFPHLQSVPFGGTHNQTPSRLNTVYVWSPAVNMLWTNKPVKDISVTWAVFVAKINDGRGSHTLCSSSVVDK